MTKHRTLGKIKYNTQTYCLWCIYWRFQIDGNDNTFLHVLPHSQTSTLARPDFEAPTGVNLSFYNVVGGRGLECHNYPCLQRLKSAGARWEMEVYYWSWWMRQRLWLIYCSKRVKEAFLTVHQHHSVQEVFLSKHHTGLEQTATCNYECSDDRGLQDYPPHFGSSPAHTQHNKSWVYIFLTCRCRSVTLVLATISHNSDTTLIFFFKFYLFSIWGSHAKIAAEYLDEIKL